MIFSMIIQVLYKFHDFSLPGTLFSDIPGFPGFPELVGALYYIHVGWHNTEVFNK